MKIIYSLIAILVLGLGFLTACGNDDPDAKYEITYMLDGEVFETDETLRGGWPQPVRFSSPTKPGYEFEGWFTKEKGGKQFRWDKSLKKDLTLYARFSIITYTIAYEDEMNVKNPNPTSYTVESDIELQNLSKEGYVFEGWYTWYGEEIKLTSITKGRWLGDFLLKARWVEVNKVVYDEMEYAMSVNQVVDSSFFNARCYDSNQNKVEIDVTVNGEVTPGNIISVTLSPKNENITPVTIENIKVYDNPEIKALKTEYLPLRDDIRTLFTATDAFEDELELDYEIISGELEMGSKIELKVTTEDNAGNIASENYSYIVCRDDIFEITDGCITGINNMGKSLENIVIPKEINGVAITSIGQQALSSCTELETVTIPNSVSYISSYAFEFSSKLIIFVEQPNNPNWGYNWNGSNTVFWETGVPDFYEDDTFRYLLHNEEAIILNAKEEQENMTIPDQVTVEDKVYAITRIGYSAFQGCRILKNLTIPTSVTSIGDYAFYYCANLKNLTIPTSVTSIGNYAFYNCRNLIDITISDGVTSIGDYAFERCSDLTSITIPDSVTSIGANAFSWCNNLTIYCISTSKPDGWDSNWNSNCPVYWGQSAPQA